MVFGRFGDSAQFHKSSLEGSNPPELSHTQADHMTLCLQDCSAVLRKALRLYDDHIENCMYIPSTALDKFYHTLYQDSHQRLWKRWPNLKSSQNMEGRYENCRISRWLTRSGKIILT